MVVSIRPDISVIVPVYNVASYVEKCLLSILDQPIDNMEVIVVDDGSTDGSDQIAETLAAADSRMRIIRQANAGLSAARNKGLARATGEFVAFIDSDDYISENMLSSMHCTAQKEQADIVLCDFSRINSSGQIFATYPMIPPYNATRMLDGSLNRAVWNKLFRRSLIEESAIRFVEGRYHEDIYFTCALFTRAGKVAYSPDAHYYWLCRQESISQRINKKHIDDVFAAYVVLKDDLIDQGTFADYEPFFVQGCMNYLVNLADRIISQADKEPETARPLMNRLRQKIEHFEHTNTSWMAWLEKHNLELHLRLSRSLYMADEYLDKSKQELIEELKRLRQESYLEHRDAEAYQNHVNFDFSQRFNRLSQWLQRFRQSYKRIALYGNGLIGKMAAAELQKQLVVVADQGARNIRDSAYPLCLPDQLPDYSFDCLIVCVLGRESGIIDYLVRKLNIEREKIHTFDLVNDVPPVDHLAVNYQNLITRLKEDKPVIGEHPLSVQIQTVSACNANCFFCPYVGSWHQQNPGRMDDDLYYRIIDQLAEYDIKKFCPYLENEPFLDKKLFDKIEYAIQRLQPESVEISSNLSILLDRHLDGLANVLANVPHELRISFHGINKETYEEVMELDYETSLENVKKVVALMQETPLNVMIRGAGAPRQTGGNAQNWFGEAEYRQYWNRELKAFRRQPRLDFFTYHDRAGQSQLKQRGLEFEVQRDDLKDFYCSRFDQWVHFLYTGEPILCCMDYNRETVFSDSVKHLNVADVFDSESFRELIKQGTGLCESKPDFICKRCISPGG